MGDPLRSLTNVRYAASNNITTSWTEEKTAI
jgi:hypothetical protein